MNIVGKCKVCKECVYHPPLKGGTHDDLYVQVNGIILHKKCLSASKYGGSFAAGCYLRHGTSIKQELNKRATRTNQLIGADYENYKRITVKQ